MNVDFKNLETYHYFIAGGAGLVVISILLFIFKGRKIRVSAFFATTLGSLAVGFGAGIITLAALGYNWKEKEKEENQGGQAGGPPGMGAPKNPGGKDQKKGGTSAKLQLAALVVKLNQLSEKPLAINLDDRKAEIAEQLKGLETIGTLPAEDAETRLKALMKLLEKDQPTLVAAGFDMARAGIVGKGKEPDNPFTSEGNKAALKALQDRISKK